MRERIAVSLRKTLNAISHSGPSSVAVVVRSQTENMPTELCMVRQT